MKSSLIYAVAFVVFSITVFGFVFWKLNNTDYSLKNVKVKVQLSASIEDEFKLFYSNDTNFDGERMLSIPIKGLSKPEDLTFNLPNGNNNFVRLDLSKNPLQTNMTIHKVTFESENKIRTYKGSPLKGILHTNKFIKTAIVDKNGVNYSFISVNEKYDPILGPAYLQQIFY